MLSGMGSEIAYPAGQDGFPELPEGCRGHPWPLFLPLVGACLLQVQVN
jgi:hypothetical protein